MDYKLIIGLCKEAILVSANIEIEKSVLEEIPHKALKKRIENREIELESINEQLKSIIK